MRSERIWLAWAATIGMACLTGCGAGAAAESRAPTLACTGAVGLSAGPTTLAMGSQRVLFSVFPQPVGTFSDQRQAAAPTVRVRFFRIVTEGAETRAAGQELRSYQPELTLTAAPGAPQPTPSGLSRDAKVFAATVTFDTPGTWGAEVFVEAPWQTAPAFTTLLFRVTPAAEPQAEPSAGIDAGAHFVLRTPS